MEMIANLIVFTSQLLCYQLRLNSREKGNAAMLKNKRHNHIKAMENECTDTPACEL